LEIDLIKETDKINAFSREKTSRLRGPSQRKILAEGFLVKQPNGLYRVGDLELADGVKLEIKFDDNWVEMQVAGDQNGNYYLTNTTCSFYPLQVYARVRGEINY
jgi:hypothetical protein